VGLTYLIAQKSRKERVMDYSRISRDQIPWPKKGQVLFSAANDWYHNACINLRYFNWDWYATGYKYAGDVLVQHVIDTRNHRDTLVFPIVFNYRQYLEVRCKEIIMLGKLLSDEMPEFPHKHTLRVLWDTCRPIIAAHEPSASETDLEAIDEAIAEFDVVDPESYSFRYPVDRKGNLSIPADLHVINLRQLRDGMDRLASFFDTVSMAFSHYLDCKAQMDNWF